MGTQQAKTDNLWVLLTAGATFWLISPSLYLDRAALDFNLGPHPHFVYHIEITLQEIPESKYRLQLFVENEKIELQKKDDRTWAPAQRLYVLSFPLHTITEAYGYVERFLLHQR